MKTTNGIDLDRKLALFDRCVEFAERYGCKGNQAVISANKGFRHHIGDDMITSFDLQLPTSAIDNPLYRFHVRNILRQLSESVGKDLSDVNESLGEELYAWIDQQIEMFSNK